jgi:hypothetical protein
MNEMKGNDDMSIIQVFAEIEDQAITYSASFSIGV